MSPVAPGALGTLRPPDEFIDHGCVLLWCLSCDSAISIPIDAPVLVVSGEQIRIAGGNRWPPKQVEMFHVHIRGLPFRIRADWFRPILF